jgi:hypothetical protein
MPMLTPEYRFTVYWDCGAWHVESLREGVVCWDEISGETPGDVSFQITKVLEAEGVGNDSGE